MLISCWAVVRADRPLENIPLRENARVLVTILPEDETGFWKSVSESALKTVWDNEEDDVYSELNEGGQ